MTQQEIDTLLERMEETIRQITWSMVDCVEEDLHTAPTEGEWSPMEILAHVKAFDDIITSRIATILTSDQPNISNIDIQAWKDIAGYAEAPLDQTLVSYQRHRAEMVWQLRHIPLTSWQRTCKHETRGVITLYDLIRVFIEHEEAHITQLAAAFEEVEEEGE
jgi:DinB superfamily